VREPSDTAGTRRSSPRRVRDRPSLASASMAEFLSPAWIAELDAAARAADDLAVDEALVVGQVVHDAPGGDVTYQVCFGPAGAGVTAGAPRPADVTLVTDRATARALHEGSWRAQDALAAGALKVNGRPEVLAGRAELLAALDRAFLSVRADTTFTDGR
jgi:hypothetical protein